MGKGFEVKQKKKKIKGHTLLDALNDVVTCPKRPKKKPFRMPVSGVYKIKGVGDVITGRIEQGTLKPNTMVEFAPTGVGGTVFSIEMHHKNFPKENMPKAGDVMFIKDEAGDESPPAKAKTFRAAVFVQDHPGQLKAATQQGDDYKGGFTPSIHVRTAKAP